MPRILSKLLIIAFLVGMAQAALARPYLKIQQVRPLEYPYIKVELSVSKITPILNLDESNFEVFENGWHVPAVHVRPADSEKDPKSIILLIDSSLSITRKQFDQQIGAVRAFAQNLDAGDRIAILSFNDKVEAHCGFTGDKAALALCINGIKQNGRNTVLYDAILEGITMAGRLKSSRHSLVVFTDGRDEGSVIRLNDIVPLAQKKSTPVFIAGTGDRSKLKPLARLSRLSGGETYHTPRSEEIKKIYLLLDQLLDNTYMLQYVSQAAKTSADGRKVELKVHIKATTGEKPFSDEDKYSFLIPEVSMGNWWQRLWEDERYLLFAAGLIILLLLFITVLALLRRPTVHVGVPAGPVKEEPDTPEELLAANRPIPEFAPKKSPTARPLPRAEDYQAYLVEKEGPHTGRKYKITWDSVSLGHGDENTIVLEDNTVSYRHAKIQRRKDAFLLYDLLSEYGTYLNGKKLLRPKELFDFDELQLGRTKLIFRRASTRSENA